MGRLKPCPFCGEELVTAPDPYHQASNLTTHIQNGCLIEDLLLGDDEFEQWNTRREGENG